MRELMLIEPDETWLDQVNEFRNEFVEAGSSMDGQGNLKEEPDPAKWLKRSRDCLSRETLPEGLVTATQFLAVRKSDGRLIGMIQVRHYFNEFLEKYGGHIGYSVRPSERNKGYAKKLK